MAGQSSSMGNGNSGTNGSSSGPIVEFTSRFTSLPVYIDRRNIEGFESDEANPQQLARVIVSGNRAYGVKGTAATLASEQNQWLQQQEQMQQRQQAERQYQGSAR